MAVTALLWSFTGLLVKLILWHALGINFVRCICALLLRTALRRGAPLRWNRQTLLGAGCFCATTMLSVLATKYTTAGNASLLLYLNALPEARPDDAMILGFFFSALLSLLSFLGERECLSPAATRRRNCCAAAVGLRLRRGSRDTT